MLVWFHQKGHVPHILHTRINEKGDGSFFYAAVSFQKKLEINRDTSQFSLLPSPLGGEGRGEGVFGYG